MNKQLAHYTVIMRDFNTEVGKEATGQSVGLSWHCFTKWWRAHLCLLCWKSFTTIMHTSFGRKAHQKWTWKSISEVRNETEFIFIIMHNIRRNVTILNRVDVNSNRWIVRGKININMTRERNNLIWMALQNKRPVSNQHYKQKSSF